MTRLRQKYKKLKRQYEWALKRPVMATIYTQDTRRTQFFHGRKIVPKILLCEYEDALERVDTEMASEFGKKLLKAGCIERKVEEQRYYDVTDPWQKGQFELLGEKYIAIEYTLEAVVPSPRF